MWDRVVRGVTAVGGDRLMERWVAQLGRPSGALGLLVGSALVESNTDLSGAVVDALRLRDGERVLDVGCGPGQGVTAAFDAADVTVHAVDPSEAMRTRVRFTHRDAFGHGDLQLHAGTLDELELDEPIDAALAVNVVYFLDDRVASFGHLRDLLAPGGRLAVGYRDSEHLADDEFGATFRRRHNVVGVEQLEADLRTAGFTGVLTVHHDEACRITVARRPGDAPPAPHEDREPPVDLTSL